MTASILIIDDDDASRMVIGSTLRRLGYRTTQAENGRVGLDLFRVDPPDLVIAGVFMPEGDGIEVILALQEAPRKPKVLAITDGGVRYGMEMLRMAKLLGADEVMAKPLSMSRLMKVVGDLLAAPVPSAPPASVFAAAAALGRRRVASHK